MAVQEVLIQSLKTTQKNTKISPTENSCHKKYGKRAGILRNRDIVDAADIVVAFWDGKSPGTKNSREPNVQRRIAVYT